MRSPFARPKLIAEKFFNLRARGVMNIEILQESFTEIESNSKEFAKVFYQNLFLDYPELKKLFVNTKIEQQEKKLMTVFVITISNLHNITYLKNLLKSLGKRHLKYGVDLENYRPLGDTLIKTLKFFLKSKWNWELEQAWQKAYQLIVELMLEGAQSETIAQSDRSLHLPSLVEKLRIEAIAKRHLRNGDSITKVKCRLLKDYYFQKLAQEIGENKTLETISKLLQKTLQRELTTKKVSLTTTASQK